MPYLECMQPAQHPEEYYLPLDGAKRRVSGEGYVSVRVRLGRWEQEHRMVMAQTLGRPLNTNETVHHRNGDRTDNRPENLELWTGHQPKGRRVADELDILSWIV